jgi:DNA-3-methyladenine glycosylase II
MTDDQVEAALTEVPGIGPWSARGFLRVALDRPDVFLTGGIALRRAIERIYGFDHASTEAELLEISDRWRLYRSLAVSYLFASECDASASAASPALAGSAGYGVGACKRSFVATP